MCLGSVSQLAWGRWDSASATSDASRNKSRPCSRWPPCLLPNTMLTTSPTILKGPSSSSMNMDPALASNRHLESVRCDALAAGYLAITNFVGSMYMGHAFTLHHTVLLSQGVLMAHLKKTKQNMGQGQGFTDNLKGGSRFWWTWFWDWFTSKSENLWGIQGLIKVKLWSVDIWALISLSTGEDWKLMSTLMKTCFFHCGIKNLNGLKWMRSLCKICSNAEMQEWEIKNTRSYLISFVNYEKRIKCLNKKSNS